MVSHSPRIDNLEEVDRWANDSLDGVTGFANDTFLHIYDNCGDSTYNLPPLPPKPVGLLKKALDRASSFSRTRPTATVRPSLATDPV